MKIEALTNIEMTVLIEGEHYGHLSCCVENEPYIACITYLYKDNALYGYTQEGKKIDMMRKNPRVCVDIVRVNSGSSWESVVIYGMYEELHEYEKLEGLDQFQRHLAGKDVYIPFNKMDFSKSDEDLIDRGAVVYKIKIEEMTGRKYG